MSNLPTHLWTPAGPARVLEPDPFHKPRPGRELCYVCAEPVQEELGEAQPFCLACAPCDECGHPAGLHEHPEDGLVEYATATCWAESTCQGCELEPESRTEHRGGW